MYRKFYNLVVVVAKPEVTVKKKVRKKRKI